ncbi:NAD(P)-dependent oxidoreductase [Nonomuraea longicatena]|uniref:NAD(P)-dependent oxidoreductase n=2 Tax=Nonomuraea longicatena TaxID=83682 RepID=A0ABP3ZGS5_9ACTN
MGTALAETLMNAGHDLTVWNRTAAKADALAARGAVKAETAAEAVAASPLVIVVTFDYASVESTLKGADLGGKVLVNLTSGRPAEARRTAEWVRGQGGEYLDGGIMAVPQMIGQPGALILYSGSRTAFDRYEGELGALAEARFMGTDPGVAPLLDLAMLTGMYGQIAGMMQGVALARSEGMSAADFTHNLLMPWLRAMLELMPGWAEEIDAKSWGTDVANLGVNGVALRMIEQAGREQGLERNLLAPLKEVVDKRVADGNADHGLQSLVEEL